MDLFAFHFVPAAGSGAAGRVMTPFASWPPAEGVLGPPFVCGQNPRLSVVGLEGAGSLVLDHRQRRLCPDGLRRPTEARPARGVSTPGLIGYVFAQGRGSPAAVRGPGAVHLELPAGTAAFDLMGNRVVRPILRPGEPVYLRSGTLGPASLAASLRVCVGQRARQHALSCWHRRDLRRRSGRRSVAARVRGRSA